ncbi:NACHT domain protein [Beggiatoa alba B18LD]|uniref:NACHT domain protein n=1 Tax=Beggiatoa alba B18LD TaxID=395493 RepID=I3CCV7_9GAMM|nr:NACHT domain-containing protein [Beggiatoa alba]EIJ41450.1 NACHT domain protein [Beggiatoa alba B18LD]
MIDKVTTTNMPVSNEVSFGDNSINDVKGNVTIPQAGRDVHITINNGVAESKPILKDRSNDNPSIFENKSFSYNPKTPLSNLETWAKSRYRQQLSLQANVLRFIKNYVSQANDPKPFVGRELALQSLNDWLADNTHPFLLLTGEAGRGKSALMLHWLAQQINTGEYTVIFVPISIRFATNDELTGLQLFFSALCDVFSELKEALPQKLEVGDYRELIFKGFELIENNSQQYLIVIDGIDEAVNHWFTAENCPIPAYFPANLHLLISARYKPNEKNGLSWLKDLNQSVDEHLLLSLSTLEKNALATAIIQLGRPLDQLAERQQFVDALFRLTDEGDPLLLTLWLGQIWANREEIPHYSIEQLKKLTPSFAGFYEQWQKEQQTLWKKQNLTIHPDDFQQILTLFAVAYAPLKLAELWEIQENIKSQNLWDYQTLRAILESAHRLVIGNAEQGYTLLHPRLADYFLAKSKNNPSSFRKTQQAFLQWGQKIVNALNQGELKPDECPQYLLQHYLAHLETTPPLIDQRDHLENYYFPLLQKNWATAWESYEGSWHGYLNNLKIILSTFQRYNATQLNKAYLATEIRCILLSATIHTLNNNLPVELVIELAKKGEWSFRRAGQIALQYTEPMEQINCLISLAESTLDKAEKEQFCQQALNIATKIEDEDDRYYAHSYVLSKTAFLRQGENKQRALSEAQDIALRIKRVEVRCYAFITLAMQLEGEEKEQTLLQVIQLAKKIQDEEDDSSVLHHIETQLRGKERQDKATIHPQDALQMARRIKDEKSRSETLNSIATQLQGKEKQQVLSQSLQIARSIEDEKSRSEVLSTITKQLQGETQLLSEALQAAQAIQDEEYRSDACPVAAQLQGEEKQQISQFSQFRRSCSLAAKAIQDKYSRSLALSAVAEQLQGEEKQKVLSLALALVLSTIKFNPSGYHALSAIVKQLQGKKEKQQPLFLALRAMIKNISGFSSYHHTLSVAVAMQLEGGTKILSQALQEAWMIQDEESCSKILRAFASQALQDAWMIQDEELSVIAMQLQDDEKQKILSTARQAVEVIQQYEWFDHKIYKVVATQLHGEAKQQALSRVLQEAGTIQNEEYRSQVLTQIIPHLKNLPNLQQDCLELVLGLSDKNRITLSAKLMCQKPVLLTYSLWLDWINRAPKKRADLLACIPDLAQAAVQFTGNPQQAVEIAQAVIDVGEWWK